jgi:hypothetical protein
LTASAARRFERGSEVVRIIDLDWLKLDAERARWSLRSLEDPVTRDALTALGLSRRYRRPDRGYRIKCV